MKLLIAEDEQATREGLLQCIPPIFTQVRATGNGQAAYQIALEMKPDVLLCDIRMPKLNGIELASLLRQHFPDIHILFISGYSDKGIPEGRHCPAGGRLPGKAHRRGGAGSLPEPRRRAYLRPAQG